MIRHARRQPAGRGITLNELMMTVVIVAIMAAVALPNYQRSVERAHWQTAQDVLRAIYRGEEVYFARNGSYRAISPFLPSLWGAIHMPNPNAAVVLGGPVRYWVMTPSPSSFLARARRQGGAYHNRDIWISQTGVITCTGPLGGWTQVAGTCTPP